MDVVKICEVVDGCEDCPKYGDDCDGDKMAEHTDRISRADAIEAVNMLDIFPPTKDVVARELMALPSADAVSRKAKCCPITETCMSIDCPVSSEYIGRPSADAVQGEWIEKYNGNGWNDFWDYTCSNCGKKYERADAVLYHANYCPNCGARMKGGEDE